MLYPILTASRELFDLDGVWAFKLDHGAGFDEEWFRRPLTETVPMPVPASYNDLYEGAEFRDHIGWVWYERDTLVGMSRGAGSIRRRRCCMRIWRRGGV